MTTPFDRLRREARALDADQRAQLALDLLESLDAPEVHGEVDKAWNLEARERLARYDAGEKATISAADLHASLEYPAQ